MAKSQTASGSWLDRLGLRGPDRAGAGKGAANTPSQSARRQLLDDIAGFLLDNDLDVSPANLLAVHAAYAGLDVRLGRKIAQQGAGSITQAWLDENRKDSGEPAADDGSQSLVAKLETTLNVFSGQVLAARTATSDYSGEIEQHVAGLAGIDDTQAFLSTFTDLARAMLDRTRQLETDMRQSEKEAAKLRTSLEKAKREADVDHLTGLPNRRAFETVLDREFREARAGLEPLVVAFCDIDHFKRINDTHGHAAGDRVIRLIAEILSEISDDKCHVARHGGEEFVMLFRGLDIAATFEKLDGLREKLATRHFVNRQTDEPLGQITFSTGIADVFDFTDPRAALRAADEALYAAKEGGRNQIRIASRTI
ncbi:MAG: GGDEF domain-containing protein [Alphaproteobacteria bacterium HGW-Alphaproteobacteria-13]|jgi:diguanylate cyclase|nr:MAG: GGDEF domain-containing protein [Alphaproteobacteria bacterium HGW-Alphaproteobacteria-13]